jgi:hypothetical protein
LDVLRKLTPTLLFYHASFPSLTVNNTGRGYLS